MANSTKKIYLVVVDWYNEQCAPFATGGTNIEAAFTNRAAAEEYADSLPHGGTYAESPSVIEVPIIE